MGNLLNPRTGTIHADVNKDNAHGQHPGSPFRRAFCDLSIAVPDTWVDVTNAKVTCEDCQFRIECAMAEAHGDFDSTGRLTNAAVRVAQILKANRDGDLAERIAVAMYPDDLDRQELFLERVLLDTRVL